MHRYLGTKISVMAKGNKLTNNSDETEVSDMISGDHVFAIPYFQRPYKWKPERLKQLNTDILKLVDEDDEEGMHFLGAVIIHGRRANPSDPRVYEVIDGQQRITTLFLYLCATVRVLCQHEEHQEAVSLFLKYLAINRETNLMSNLKLHPCKEDRKQLNKVFVNLLSDPALRERLGAFSPKYLPSNAKESGTLLKNYQLAKAFLEEQVANEGIEQLRKIYSAILQSMSVVQIDVMDPTNGPKIFDSLNSRQEPMTIGDLVRNEIFSRMADKHPDEIEQMDEQNWQPFYRKFQQDGRNLFDQYFFPFGLVKNPNLKKSQVYSHLRDDWKKVDDPQKVISELSEYQDAFIDLALGTNHSGHSKKVAEAFANLYESGAPSTTYPFLMQLSKGLGNGSIAEVDGLGVLQALESFLVRRAICGHEPTGLHSVFKRLWIDCKGKPTGKNVIDEIKGRKTVVWPDDEAVKKAIELRPLYGVAITHYLLVQYDKSYGGDNPNIIPWIEHVLPERPEEVWFQVFNPEQHKAMKDLLANLIPLSQEMNQSLGNKAYSEKSSRYSEDSSFKSARKFTDEYSNWTPELLNARSATLAKWAIKRWKD